MRSASVSPRWSAAWARAETVTGNVAAPGAHLLYALCLSGYLGTFAVLMTWYSWLAPSEYFPVSLVLLVLVTPLLFPLRGILHARRYTIAWSCFLALLYFTHGVVAAWNEPAVRYLGILEIACSVLWFTGGMLFIYTGKSVNHAGH